MKSRLYFFYIIILFMFLLFTFSLGKANLWFFALICIALIIGFISYNLGVRNGIILGMFSSFIYGSLLFYLVFESYIILNSFIYYIWIIMFPLCTVIFGLYGESINKIVDENKDFERYILNNTYIDPITELPTRGAFYKNLSTESSTMKIHPYPLTIMLVKLDFNKELMAIFGIKEYTNIIKLIIKKIETVIGVQNRKFLLSSGKIAIFLNYIDIDEAELLKKKLQKELENFTVLQTQDNEFHFNFRIVVKKYEMDTEPIKFESYLEKDLEYEN